MKSFSFQKLWDSKLNTVIKEVSDQQVPPVLAAGKDTPVCQQTRQPPDNEGSHLGASARNTITASIK